MADVAVNTPTTVAAETPKGKKVAKKVTAATAKKPRTKPTHPPVQEMVDAAIKALKERRGTSLIAIKKYVAANYKIDSEKLAPFIRKYLKNSVLNGKLVQTKGTGASGSFKLARVDHKPVEKKSKTLVKKPKADKPKKAKAAAAEKKVAKKAATAATEKKKVAVAKVKAVKKAGTVKSKAPKEKSTKPRAPVKPKAPKPKKAAPAPKKTAKK